MKISAVVIWMSTEFILISADIIFVRSYIVLVKDVKTFSFICPKII